MVGVKRNTKKASVPAIELEPYPMYKSKGIPILKENTIRMNTTSTLVMSQQMQYQVKNMRKQGMT